jgi:hypothetical protein
MRDSRLLVVFLILFWPLNAALAEGNNLYPGENFQVPLPEGWKIGWGKNDETLQMTELVPAAETVENWTQMVTVQIFKGRTDLNPKTFSESMAGLFQRGCDKVGAGKIGQRTVNGYASAQILIACTREAQSGRGSLTVVRSFAGNDSFYVVQMAWRTDPFALDAMPISREQFKEGLSHLNKVVVCDTRGNGHPCEAPAN